MSTVTSNEDLCDRRAVKSAIEDGERDQKLTPAKNVEELCKRLGIDPENFGARQIKREILLCAHLVGADRTKEMVRKLLEDL